MRKGPPVFVTSFAVPHMMISIDHNSFGHGGDAASTLFGFAEVDVGWPAKRIIARAWLAFCKFDLYQLEQRLTQLRQTSRSGDARGLLLSQQELLLSAALSIVRDDVDAAMRFADDAARGEQTKDMARVTSVLLQFGALRNRNWRQFDTATSICPGVLVYKPAAVLSVLCLTVEAAAEMRRSRLMVARRFITDAVRRASQLRSGKSFALANAVPVLGELLYEQGELDEANALLRRQLANISRYGCADALEVTFITLSRIAYHRGQWKMAGLLLHELVNIAKERGWPRVMASGYGQMIDLQYCLRDIHQGRAVWHDLQLLLSQSAPVMHRGELEKINWEATLRMSALSGSSLELVSELRRCIGELAAQGNELRTVKISMILVEVLTVLGEEVQAEFEMLACLKIAMRSGLFQSLLRGSAILREKMIAVFNGNLLTRFAEGELRAYLASLIGRERETAVSPEDSAALGAKQPITSREREILLKMSQGQSNKEIAKDLGIGPETVKSHAKRIFAKLGVATRIEAVSCANDLSLI